MGQEMVMKPRIEYMPSVDFTCEEMALFEHQFQDGFDLSNDERRNQWQQKFHPDVSHPTTYLDPAPTPTTRCIHLLHPQCLQHKSPIIISLREKKEKKQQDRRTNPA